MLKRGDRIGRYTIDRLLGEGGMGAAYLAHHEAIAGFKKTVVVKVLQQDKARDPGSVELFLREARVGGRLSHTNIVQIFDIGEERGAHFMAMEFVDGLTLLQATRRCWQQGRGIPLDVAVRVIAVAATGLHYAHTFKHRDGSDAGVVHRDLSPDNIMIARDGTVKVLDFGVARIGGSEATRSGDLKGKIPYMPPEQLKGDVDIDARADLYALGITLYWCIAGRRPFVGDMASMMGAIARDAPPSLRSFNPQVPPDLEAIVMTLLEKERDKRIATAEMLAARLSPFVAAAHGNAPLAELVASVQNVEEPVGGSLPGRPAMVAPTATATAMGTATATAPAPAPAPATALAIPPAAPRSHMDDDTHELAPVTLVTLVNDADVNTAVTASTDGDFATSAGTPAVNDPTAAFPTLRVPQRQRAASSSRPYVAVGIAVALAVAGALALRLLFLP